MLQLKHRCGVVKNDMLVHLYKIPLRASHWLAQLTLEYFINMRVCRAWMLHMMRVCRAWMLHMMRVCRAWMLHIMRVCRAWMLHDAYLHGMDVAYDACLQGMDVAWKSIHASEKVSTLKYYMPHFTMRYLSFVIELILFWSIFEDAQGITDPPRYSWSWDVHWASATRAINSHQNKKNLKIFWLSTQYVPIVMDVWYLCHTWYQIPVTLTDKVNCCN